MKKLKNILMIKFIKHTIPRNIRLAEAPSFGLPIMLYDEKCKGAEAYESINKRIFKKTRRIRDMIKSLD